MALQGTLKDFSVVDIFQLLGQQGKTGTLGIVTSNQEETHIVFEKGNIVFARFVRGHEDLKIGNMLYSAGLITQNQLQIALDDHKKTMRNVGDALMARKYITATTLKEIIALQTKEVLFRVLQWKNGAYKFKGGAVAYNDRIMQPMSTDFILMDGVRQIDEWPGLLRRVGSLESVFALLPEGMNVLEALESDGAVEEDEDDIDAAFAEFDGGGDSKKSGSNAEALEPNEKVVLKLVNGKRSIDAIIARSRLGRFDTVDALVKLSEKGLTQQLQGVTAQETAKLYSTASSSGSNFKGLIFQLVMHFLCLVVAGALILTLRPITMGDTASKETAFGKRVKADAESDFMTRLLEQRLRNSLEVYRAENLAYPDDVSVLTEKNLLSKQDVVKLNKANIYYFKDFDSYGILSQR